MKYDYLIVGAGLFGAVFAREMTDFGKKCLVIEKRKHIGGNCYTNNIEGIHVHEYGPHIFHTNSIKIWNYVNRFSEFNNFVYRPKVKFDDSLYSFPINLFTLYQVFGVQTPYEARKKIDAIKKQVENPQNLEDWILSQVGEEIYKKFIYGYTKKQWGTDPKNLPISIIKRLPIRFTMDDNYFNDKYQGIPKDGYTKIFEKLLQDVPFDLNVDYLSDREYFDKIATKIVYTGAIDEFYNYDMGVLEWRSLSFEHQNISNLDDFQGNAVINYTNLDIPYTRIIEHKHFNIEVTSKINKTFVTKEYPQKWNLTKDRFYPINDERNDGLHKKYSSRIDNNKYILGGRIADYIYYDMHQIIGSALVKTEKEKCQ